MPTSIELSIGIKKDMVFPDPFAALMSKLNFFRSGLTVISNV